MKQFIIIATLASAVLSASGQNSIDEVLRSLKEKKGVTNVRLIDLE